MGYDLLTMRWRASAVMYKYGACRISMHPAHLCVGGAGGVARERLASALRLDAGEPLELLGLDRDTASEADLAGGTLDEGHTVRVEGLVDGGSAGLGAGEGNAASLGGLERLGLVAGTELLDDGGLHRELDQVEGEEPDDVLM